MQQLLVICKKSLNSLTSDTWNEVGLLCYRKNQHCEYFHSLLNNFRLCFCLQHLRRLFFFFYCSNVCTQQTCLLTSWLLKFLLVCQTVLGQMRALRERHTWCWLFLLQRRSSESHFTKTSILIHRGSKCSCLIHVCNRFGVHAHGGAQNLTGGSPEQAAADDPVLSTGVILTSLLRCFSTTVITWHSVVLPKAERITPRPCFFIACSSCWIQT